MDLVEVLLKTPSVLPRNATRNISFCAVAFSVLWEWSAESHRYPAL